MEAISKSGLGFAALVKGFTNTIQLPSDKRNKKKYELQDAYLSALACMFYKSENMLQFQERMAQKHHRNNLQSNFKIKETPKDNQLRELMAQADDETFAPVFKEFLTRVQRGNHLKQYRLHDRYPMSWDGTEYYTSESVSCSKCIKTKDRHGNIKYKHRVLQGAITHPGQRQILSVMPEEVCHHDGADKEDSENAAFKRKLDKFRKDHPRMKLIHLMDALFTNEPTINKIHEKDDKFILRVKAGSHKFLFEQLKTATKESKRVKTKTSQLEHKWVNNVQLFKGSELRVNVLELYQIPDQPDGKQKSTRIGVWITDLDVSDDTVEMLVKTGRARWKIENEGFNILKNHGYNLCHNWGHVKGESFAFYTVTLIGFFMHQLIERTDELFSKCRSKISSARRFWDEMKYVFNRIFSNSWEDLLHNFLDGFIPAEPPPA